MNIDVLYNKDELERAVTFIGTHNPNFTEQFVFIKNTITDMMFNILTDFPNCLPRGTMGFYIVPHVVHKEDINHDDNYVRFNIYVDAAVGISEVGSHIYSTIDLKQGNPWK